MKTLDRGKSAWTFSGSTTYSYTNTPKIGEFLISAEGGGYLRKVTGVTKQGSQVIATTESASLNQIFENLDINTTIKLESVPASTQPAASSK